MATNILLSAVTFSSLS